MNRQLKLLLPALCAACVLAPAGASQTGAMVVVRDPATGQLRAPTAAEAQALDAQRASLPALAAQLGLNGAPQPVITTGADGTLRANIGRESLIYAITQRNADGKLHMQCVKGPQAAASALTHTVPATVNAEEHDHDKQ